MILDKINSPADVKKLSVNEMNSLADEIREALFNRLTKIGGHFGPNFGFVEATIAMHYVFLTFRTKVTPTKSSLDARQAISTTLALLRIRDTATRRKANTISSTSDIRQRRWLLHLDLQKDATSLVAKRISWR